MTIGGYISGDGYTRFTGTKNLKKMSGAAETYFKKDYGTVPVDEAKEFLLSLGKKGKGALKSLPKDGVVNFLSAHGGMQLCAGNKNILNVCENLRNPVKDFLVTVPKRLFSVLKLVK